MCTAITLQSAEDENFFGRTLDFSYPLEPGIYIVPKNYEWYMAATMTKCIDRYSFICVGQKVDEMIGVYDGVNEQGFAAAALYFKDYGYYNLPIQNKNPIGSADFLHYILGSCSCVDDLKELLKNVVIVSQSDDANRPSDPLHWIATDRSGKSVVIEQTRMGLKIFKNPIGVLTNSPDFYWQITNLRNYMDVSVDQPKKAYWGNLPLTSFGHGGGSTPLPGGFTSPERFVRASFLKTHVQVSQSQSEAIMTFFHIMKSLFIPKGIVRTERGAYEYSKYVALMNTNTCEYYFKTQENDQIIRASLWDYYTDSTQLIFLGSLVRLPVLFESL